MGVGCSIACGSRGNTPKVRPTLAADKAPVLAGQQCGLCGVPLRAGDLAYYAAEQEDKGICCEACKDIVIVPARMRAYYAKAGISAEGMIRREQQRAMIKHCGVDLKASSRET